jgi:hypothetical protein
MSGLEGREPTERRAFDGAIPDWTLRHDAAPLQPLPQASFELDLEVVRVGKALIAGGVVAFGAFGPAFPHRLQQLILLELLSDPVGLVDDRRGLAEQVDVRNAVVLAAHLHRRLKLEHGAALVGRAVGALPD